MILAALSAAFMLNANDAALRPQIEEQLIKCWDVEHGGLVEGADYEYLYIADDLIAQLNWEDLRSDLGDISYAARLALDEQNEIMSLEEQSLSYYGNCRITFYCNCSACCGQWAGGPTASGTAPTAGWTVASGDLPFGTHVLIDGHEYCVEDRGVGSGQIDIYVGSHSEALQRGLYYTDVYVIGG